MKNFTKLTLILSMLFGIVGGVSSVKAIVLGDEITSLSGITDGTKFIISDGTKADYFYGTGSGSGENEIKNAELASIPAGSYFYFTLEKYTGEDIPDAESPADNIYRIKITNADGTGYPYGSNLGYYLNSILTFGEVVISGPEAGWSNDGNVMTNALWYVSYDDVEKGFSFQNVYRKDNGRYSWLAIGNNFVADQQYLKVYSEPADPLATEKAALSAKITRANMYNALAYTDASFAALTAEITTAQDALDAAADAESLTTATTNLQAKIDALALKEGYSNLTEDMMYTWTGWDAEAVKGNNDGYYAYALFESTGQPYGDPGVNAFADLSYYSKLYIISTGGTPRFLLNRDQDNGQWSETEAESHLIDNTRGGWSAKYFSQEGNVYTVDLAQIIAEKGFAHLHAIKTNNNVNVTVSGMYLYDQLHSEKADLQAAISLGNNQNSFAKTTASWNALQTKITAGVTELANVSATSESLTNAKNAITTAIAGLKLQAGYANLTADMFMTHASTAAGVAVTAKPGCEKVLNESTGLPYGDGNVSELNWADLTPYEQFIVIASTGTPRFCMNRLEAGGQQAETKEDSKMIDINPNNSFTWSTEKYQTIDGSKYIIDLESIVTDYGFARLHCIKGANYGNVTATDFLIYAAKSKAEVGAAGYATFSSIMNVDMTGVNAYSAKYTGGEVVLTPVTEVPANTGVIIQAAAGTYNLTNIESAAAIADNELEISDGTVTGDESTIYVLNKVNDKVGFYLLKSGNKLDAGKAYLRIDGADGARAFIGISGMEETTGISAVKQAEGAKKNEIYNLNGQRVSKPTKGLFIKNGVKFWVD